MDVFSKAKRSQVMSRIHSKDTSPERIVRSMLHRMGLRFRLHVRGLPGTPDMVFAKHSTVVEVRGCFWHQHENCQLAAKPATRKIFWEKKFQRNVERDEINRMSLQKLGWRTIVVWECELKNPARLERKLRRLFGIRPN